MPDEIYCKEHIWHPFIKEQLKDYDNKYLIGHSTGAVCIMRLLETMKVKGAFLVSGSTKNEGEFGKITNYYPTQHDSVNKRPWRWDLMKKNSDWLMHIGADDDEFIPKE